jgi:hypothetical protein
VTEAELQTCVIDLAHVYGWKVAHFRPAMTSKGWRTPVGADGAGFPDLFMVRGDHVLVVELKGDKGKPTSDQNAWLDALYLHCDNEQMVWRPADWHSGKILANLKDPVSA